MYVCMHVGVFAFTCKHVRVYVFVNTYMLTRLALRLPLAWSGGWGHGQASVESRRRFWTLDLATPLHKRRQLQG